MENTGKPRPPCGLLRSRGSPERSFAPRRGSLMTVVPTGAILSVAGMGYRTSGLPRSDRRISHQARVRVTRRSQHTAMVHRSGSLPTRGRIIFRRLRDEVILGGPRWLGMSRGRGSVSASYAWRFSAVRRSPAVMAPNVIAQRHEEHAAQQNRHTTDDGKLVVGEALNHFHAKFPVWGSVGACCRWAARLRLRAAASYRFISEQIARRLKGHVVAIGGLIQILVGAFVASGRQTRNRERVQLKCAEEAQRHKAFARFHFGGRLLDNQQRKRRRASDLDLEPSFSVYGSAQLDVCPFESRVCDDGHRSQAAPAPAPRLATPAYTSDGSADLHYVHPTRCHYCSATFSPSYCGSSRFC